MGKKVDKLVNKESWVMDGNYKNSLSERIKYSTHIVYLYIPWYKSVYRIISRMIQYRNKPRPDLNIKCKEKPNIEFVKFLLWLSNSILPIKIILLIFCMMQTIKFCTIPSLLIIG